MKYALILLIILSLAACVDIDKPQTDGIPEYTRTMDLSQWSVRVASLNVFGLWVFSKYKAERMPVIGKVLHDMNLDFIFLQEAWTGDAQRDIQTNAQYKYTHYYDVARTVGSGLLTLSPYQTVHRSFRPFAMLGPLSEIMDGETLSGKGVSIDTVKIKGLPISMVNTHTISRPHDEEAYNWEDGNTPDRLMGIFEIFQHMIEQLDSDAFIVAGDFNMNYKNVEYWTWLKLTSLEGNLFEVNDHVTCTSCAGNSLHGPITDGQIDYVFTSPRLRIMSSVQEFKKQTAPIENGQKQSNLSDHYGWLTQVGGQPSAVSKNPTEVRKNTLEAITFIRTTLEKHLDHFLNEVVAHGFEDRICYECRIRDSIKTTRFYESVLTGHENSADAAIIRRRLDSYFQIFR